MEDYFCGWYLKFQNGQQTVAVIPAYHISCAEKNASIQVITDDGAWIVPFLFGEFHQEKGKIAIGKNIFAVQGVSLDLHGPGIDVVGTLRFGPFDPIAYDIMGPFKYVPFLQCRHSVISMKHSVSGVLRINGKCVPFENGQCYIEGDRGSSFPSEYMWTQCCYPEGSVMLSVADIPFAGLHFTGIIGVIHHRGREYRLATYLGARPVRLSHGNVEIYQGKLTLSVRWEEKKGHPLAAPVEGKMSRTIHETASEQVHFCCQRKGETLTEFVSDKASLEYEYKT